MDYNLIIAIVLIYWFVTMVLNVILLKVNHVMECKDAQWWTLLYEVLSPFTVYHTISVLIVQKVEKITEISEGYDLLAKFLSDELGMEWASENDFNNFLKFVAKHHQDYADMAQAVDFCIENKVIELNCDNKFVFNIDIAVQFDKKQ